MRKRVAGATAILACFAAVGVALGAGSSPEFTFSTDEPGSTFQCSLDSGTPATCSSPKSYSGLAPGKHTVTITVGFTVPQPLKSAFTISPTPVVAGETTTLDSTPSTCDADPCTYLWKDAIDGSTYTTAASFSYTFHSTTTHQMQLVITDATGATASSTQSFDVTPAAASAKPRNTAPPTISVQ